MGIAYRCDAAKGLTVAVWDGEVTSDQWRRHMATLASDPEWGAGQRSLTDLTGVSRASRPSDARVVEMADAFLAQLPGQAVRAKWATVADDVFEEARKFGESIESRVERMIVFNNLDTACAWLGADVSDVSAIVDELRSEIRSQQAI